MDTRWTRRRKRALQRLLPMLFTECPSGTDHWVFERWCLCEHQDTPGQDTPREGTPSEDTPARDTPARDASGWHGALGSGSDRDGTCGGTHDGVFDLQRGEWARQGPEGYRPGNTPVQIGDYVQPDGLGLRPPLAWKVVGFEARGDNPKYRVIVEHSLSEDRLTLENLARNTRPPGEANDPERIGRLSEVCEGRPANPAAAGDDPAPGDRSPAGEEFASP